MTAADNSAMLDLIATDAQGVEVEIRADGTVLWVNVDGVCRLRICQIPPSALYIIDNRETNDDARQGV